jgi:hypothetical protein
LFVCDRDFKDENYFEISGKEKLMKDGENYIKR